MRRYQVLTCALLSALALAPLGVEAAGKVTGLSVSPSTAKVSQPVTLNINGTGEKCYVHFDFGGGNWGGHTTDNTWFVTLPNTLPWGPAGFAGPGTFTITATKSLLAALQPSCEVEGGKQTTTVTIEKVQASIVEWKAVPSKYQGACPATITFSGKIAVDYHPTLVVYAFIRSDGGTAPDQSGNFTASQNSVQTTWTLGGPNLPNPSGWMTLKILYPSLLESPKASFVVACVQRREAPPKPPGPPLLQPKPKVGPPPVERK